jgi:hypothetical protein
MPGSKILWCNFPESPMVGIPKPYWTKPPSLVQFLSSLTGLEWCQCSHQMESPMWTVLDIWENSLYYTSPELARILCVGVNLSILLPAPTCKGGALRSTSIWKLGSPKKMACFTNWQLKDDEWPPEHIIHYYSQALGHRMGLRGTIFPSICWTI